jgi:hypothetical protein
MTSPTSETPPPADASAAHAPAGPPPAESTEATLIVEVSADPMMGQIVTGSEGEPDVV